MNEELKVIENEETELVDTEDVFEETENEESGDRLGLGMLIGAGLTLAVGAGIKVGKKLYTKKKAAKETEEEESEETETKVDKIKKLKKKLKKADGDNVVAIQEEETK